MSQISQNIFVGYSADEFKPQAENLAAQINTIAQRVFGRDVIGTEQNNQSEGYYVGAHDSEGEITETDELIVVIVDAMDDVYDELADIIGNLAAEFSA